MAQKLIKITFPEFKPTDFNLTGRTRDNANNFYIVDLPQINKTVHINCNDEFANIHEKEIGNKNWKASDDNLIIKIPFDNDLPNEAKQWLPIIKEVLKYSIEEKTLNSPKQTFSLPIAWLPNSIRANVSSDYIDWLQRQGKKAEIAKDGVIVADEDYREFYTIPCLMEDGTFAKLHLPLMITQNEVRKVHDIISSLLVLPDKEIEQNNK
jgi:hypothetical protein